MIRSLGTCHRSPRIMLRGHPYNTPASGIAVLLPCSTVFPTARERAICLDNNCSTVTTALRTRTQTCRHFPQQEVVTVIHFHGLACVVAALGGTKVAIQVSL